MAEPSPAALNSRALRSLAQREHSRAELRRKLLRYACDAVAHAAHAAHAARAGAAAGDLAGDVAGTEPAGGLDRASLDAQVEQVLDQLTAAGLISEERVAEAVVNAKSARYGGRRLRQILQAKGLDGDLVEQTLAAARATEFERALAVWRRRFAEPPTDAREQARQSRFLAARGFEGDVIRRLLRPRDDDPVR